MKVCQSSNTSEMFFKKISSKLAEKFIIPDLPNFKIYKSVIGTEFRNIMYTVPIAIPRPYYVNNPLNFEEHFSNLPKMKITPADMDAINHAALIAKRTMQFLFNNIAIGNSGDAIDRIIFQKITDSNAYPSLFLYRGYRRSSFISPNNVVNHGMPEYENFVDGDIVTIDFAVYYQGYHIDIADTVLLGQVDSFGKELCKTAKQLTYNIIDICRPGQSFNMISKVVRNTLKRTHYSIAKEFAGHGIGRNLYESPQIFYDGTPMEGVMEEGMIFTIEPIICEGSSTVKKWPNNVTFSTKDESRAAKFERTVMITSTGAKILTD